MAPGPDYTLAGPAANSSCAGAGLLPAQTARFDLVWQRMPAGRAATQNPAGGTAALIVGPAELEEPQNTIDYFRTILPGQNQIAAALQKTATYQIHPPHRSYIRIPRCMGKSPAGSRSTGRLHSPAHHILEHQTLAARQIETCPCSSAGEHIPAAR